MSEFNRAYKLHVYNAETQSSEEAENLYAIKFTPAGPILKIVFEISVDRFTQEEYFKIKKEAFTFDEAKKVVVEWFIDRASYIERLEEKEYFNVSDTKQKDFTEYLGGYFEELNDADFKGGRA